MPDFDWLNEIPDTEWEPQNDGFAKFFTLSWFLEKSDVAITDWARLFDVWGAEQERAYQQFPCPPAATGEPLAFIVFGAWADRSAR